MFLRTSLILLVLSSWFVAFWNLKLKSSFLAETNSSAKSAADLAQELVNAKKELFNLRFQNATNQLDNTSRIKEVRKNIARIQTVITQKEKVAE